MPRVSEIVDASGDLSTLNLLNGSGWQLADHQPAELSEQEVNLEGPPGWFEVVEALWFDVLGASADATAVLFQDLVKRLRKARQRFKTRWQKAPVYWKVQHTSETNPRYAIIKGAARMAEPDSWDVFFETAGKLERVGLRMKREHPWRGDPPGAVPAAVTLTKSHASHDKDQAVVVNEADPGTGTALTHVYNYDDSAVTKWSGNLVNATAWNPWVVSGSTPAANDAVYFGFSTRSARCVIVPIATAAAYSGTVVAEVWTGAAWAAVSEYSVLNATSLSTIFKRTGLVGIAFRPPAGWVANDPGNGVTALWLRLRISALTSWTTNAVTDGTETAYAQRQNYVEISNARIGGDAPPRVMLRLRSGNPSASPGNFTPSAIWVGAKRNPGTFQAWLNAHQYDLPSGWSRTLGTDATEVADAALPSGYRLRVTFATDTTLVSRFRWTGTGKLADWEGQYRVFLPLFQTAGAAGDVEAKLRFYLGPAAAGTPYVDTPLVPTKATPNVGYELIDLDLMTLPFHDPAYGDSLAQDLNIELHIKRVTGSTEVYCPGFMLLPRGEFRFKAWQESTVAGLHMNAESRLEVDLGVLADRTALFTYASGNWVLTGTWARDGSLNLLEPATQYRFYFLQGRYGTAYGSGALFLATPGLLDVQLHKTNSYLALRGNA